MNNWRTIRNLALIFGIVSVVFTVVAAYITDKFNQILYTSTAPASIFQYSVIIAILPFLFAAILSFVVAFFSSRAAKSAAEKDPKTQKKKTQKKAQETETQETESDLEDVFKEAPT